MNDNIVKFYDEYRKLFQEDDNNLTIIDLLSEIGSLTNEYKIDKDDVKYILDNYPVNFDIDNLLQIIYDEWEDEENKKIYNQDIIDFRCWLIDNYYLNENLSTKENEIVNEILIYFDDHFNNRNYDINYKDFNKGK